MGYGYDENGAVIVLEEGVYDIQEDQSDFVRENVDLFGPLRFPCHW